MGFALDLLAATIIVRISMMKGQQTLTRTLNIIPQPNNNPYVAPYPYINQPNSFCALMPNSGYCQVSYYNSTVIRWFFNITTQTCIPFLYSGCGGNKNRFITQQQCQQYCKLPFLQDIVQLPNSNVNNIVVPPAQVTTATTLAPTVGGQLGNNGLPVCGLTKNSGFLCANGGIPQQRFYWNYAKWDCLAFLHNGCGGNQNSFATKRECKQRCQPYDGPTCLAAALPAEQFGNNCQSLQCPQGYVCRMGAFFAQCCPTEIEDEIMCPTGVEAYQIPGQGHLFADLCTELTCPTGLRCVQGKVYAKCCPATFTTDSTLRTNDFLKTKSNSKSSAHLISVPVTPKCLYLPNVGPCKSRLARWYFDVRALTCLPFVYGGCQGNSNNFLSKADCNLQCLGIVDSALNQPFNRADQPITSAEEENRLIGRPACEQPKEAGTCSKRVMRWYWDQSRMECLTFLYTGCLGNENNFDSRQKCEEKCRMADGPSCALGVIPHSTPSIGNTVQWTVCDISSRLQQCPPGFICRRDAFNSICCNATTEEQYSAEFNFQCANGDPPYSVDNRPVWASSCSDILCPAGFGCLSGPIFAKCCKVADFDARIIDNSVANENSQLDAEGGSICLLPKRPGRCRGAFVRWYYSGTTKKCERFIYGGCDGNENNFQTIQLCQNQCIKTRGNVVDDSGSTEMPVVGPCDQAQKRLIPGRFIAQCTDKGYFNLVQCHGATGYCWCVHPQTGQEISNTRVPPGTLVHCPKCHADLAESLKTGSQWGPKCNTDGFYSTLQCDSNVNQCWCAHPQTGVELSDTRRAATDAPENCPTLNQLTSTTAPPAASESLGPCQKEYMNITSHGLLIGARLPQCTEGGFYEVRQCHGSTGYCWCVDPEFGKQISGTLRSPSNMRDFGCGACHLMKAESYKTGPPLLGAFVPQCDNYGNFLTVQCHGAAGSCWCVDAMGTELPDSRVGRGKFPDCAAAIARENNKGVQTPVATSSVPSPKPSTTTTTLSSTATTTTQPTTSTMFFFTTVQPGPCSNELRDIQKAPIIGAYRPRCMKSGYYKLVQCHASTGYCWCADVTTGAEIPNTRIGPGQGPPVCSNCHKKKAETYQSGMPSVGAFVPQCHDSGFFEPLQCHGSTGYCWCVNHINGEEIQGTRKGPGSSPPVCPQPSTTTDPTRLDIPLPTETIDPILGPRPDAPIHPSGPCKESEGKNSAPGRPEVKCTSSGYYALTQCHGSTGFCWCVDPQTGTEVQGTRQKAGQDFACPECLQRKADGFSRGAPPPGAFVYSCESTGKYSALQCHGSSGQCWCVNKTTGQEIMGTRIGPGDREQHCETLAESPEQLSLCQSHRARALAQGLLGAFAPMCDNNGLFQPVQCHSSIGMCWCVDTSTGIEVPNTRKGVGEGPPDCNLQTPISQQTATTVSPVKSSICLAMRENALRSNQFGTFVPSCTDEGKFSDRQCHGSTGECYCAHSESGNEVPGSRVPASHELKCAECKKLFDLISNGQINPQILPQCDSFGDFVPLQCNSTVKECWCVTPDAGSVIGGTRRPISQKDPVCKNRAEIASSREENPRRSGSDPSDLIHLPNILNEGPGPVIPSYNMVCNEHKKAVGNCNDKLLRWYFDDDHQECLAFTFSGCGGNLNNFQSYLECASRCKIPDGQPCAGSRGPYVEPENGQLVVCTGNEQCPNDHTCRMGAFFGFCCHQQTEDIYFRNYRPTCKNAGPVFSIDAGGFQQPLLGSNCSDNFCPQNTSCEQGDIFAWCCGGKILTIEFVNDPQQTSKIGDLPEMELTIPQDANSNYASACEAPKDAGRCRGKFLRWYFEPKYYECLAFSYGGCAGNQNRYETKSECELACKHADAPLCAGNALPYFDADLNATLTCQSPDQCPEGYMCRFGAFFGSCCETANEELFRKNYSPECPKGSNLIEKEFIHSFKEPLLGAECKDRFCPGGTQCQQGELFAFCCAPEVTTETELPQDSANLPTPSARCLRQKDPGFIPTASSPLSRFYYDHRLLQCLQFTFYGTPSDNENNFATLADCETTCIGHRRREYTNHGCTVAPKGQSSCSEIACPAGYQCNPNEFVCCNTTLAIEISLAMGTNYCSDGTSSAWLSEEDHLPILAATCSDMLCPAKYRCEQATSSFARCCSGKPQGGPAADDATDFEKLAPPRPNCTAPKDPGSCKGRQDLVTRWYYNQEKKICTAFAHSGCGGNGNLFPTQADCIENCIPQDGPTCYAGKPSYVSETGESPSGPSCLVLECPDGWKCSMGFVGAVCCNATHEGLFEDAYNNTCHNGHEAYRRFNGQYHEHYLGDSCDDLLCPENYECQQINSLFAKCCSISKDVVHPEIQCPIGDPVNTNDAQTFCTESVDCPVQSFCHTPVPNTYGKCCPVPKLPTFLLDILDKQNCTQIQETAIEECLRPFTGANQFSPLNLNHLSVGVLPTGNKIQQLNNTCTLYQAYINCTGSVLPKDAPCFSYGNHVLRKVIGFACAENSVSLLNRNKACMEETSKSEELKQCEAQLNVTLEESLREGFSQGFKKICEAMDRVSNCAVPIFKQKCSQDLAEFVRQLVERTQRSLFGGKCREESPLLLPLPGGIQGPGPVIISESQQDVSLPPFGPGPVKIETDRKFPEETQAAETSANEVLENLPPGLRQLGPGPVILPSFTGCTSEESMRFRVCLFNLRNGSSTFGQLLSGNGSSILISEQLLSALPNVCDNYEKFSECLYPLQSSKTCKPPARVVIDGILGFSCQPERLAQWQTHGLCFSQVMNKTEAQACVTDAESQLEAAVRSREYEGACGIIDDFLECIRPSLAEQCGAEGSTFFHQVYGQLSKVLLGSCKQACKQIRDAMLSNGAPLIGSHIPQCQPNGKYKPVQCSGSTGSCWCVNVDSGIEIPGSRTPPGSTPQCGESLCSLHKESEKETCKFLVRRPFTYFSSLLANYSDTNNSAEIFNLGAMPEFGKSLNSICQQFFSCKKNLPVVCMDRKFKQLEPAYNFLCSIGIPQLIQSFSCIQNFQTRPEFKICLYSLSGLLEEDIFSKNCRKLRQVVNCIQPSVVKYCSPATWNSFKLIHEKFAHLLDPSCHLFPSSQDAKEELELQDSGATAVDCSESTIQREKMCHSPYFSILNPVTILANPLKAKEICRLYISFSSCLNMPQCSAVGIALAKLMNEVCYGFETSKEQSMTCLSNIDNRQQCKNQQREVSTALLYSGEHSTICRKLNNLRQCASLVVRKTCSAQAAMMLDHLHRTFQSALMQRCKNSHEKDQDLVKLFAFKTREPLKIHCSDEDAAAALLCFRNLAPYLSPVVGLSDPLNIQDACLAYNTFRDCIGRLKECIPELRRGINQLFQYICSDGRQAFQEVASCFAEINEREDTQYCATPFSNVELFTEEGKANTCKKVQYLMACIRPIVPAHCGPRGVDPFNIIFAIHRVFMNGFDPNCELVLPGPASTAQPITVSSNDDDDETECSSEELASVRKCYEPLLESWSPLSILLDPDDIAHLCTTTRNILSCGGNSMRCATNFMKAVEAVFKEICTNLETAGPTLAQSELLPGLTCLSEAADEVQECRGSFEVMFKKERPVSVYLPLSVDEYCQSISNILICAQETVTKECGSVFFAILVNLHDTFLQTLSTDCGVRQIDPGSLCTGEAYIHQAQCDTALEAKFQTLQNQQPDLTKLTVRDFAFICTALQEYSECAAQNPCASSLSELAASIYDRTCAGDLSPLEHIISCIATLTEVPEAESCNQLLPGDVSLEQLAAGQFGSTPLGAFACEQLPLFLNCLHPIVVQKCEAPVWPLIQDAYRFFTKSLNLPCGGQSSMCTEEQIGLLTVCFKEFKGIQAVEQKDFNLDETCRHFTDFEHCIGEVACQSPLTSEVQNFFKLICTEKRNEFQEFNRCIHRIELSDIWEPSCQPVDTTNNSIIEAITSIAHHTDPNQICEKANEFITCAGSGIERTCGIDSLRFLTVFYHRYVQGTSTQDCVLLGAETFTYPPVLITTTAPLVVFSSKPFIEYPFLPEMSCNYATHPLPELVATFGNDIDSYCSTLFNEITKIDDFSDDCKFHLFLGLENLRKFACDTAKTTFQETNQCLSAALMQNNVIACRTSFPTFELQELKQYLTCRQVQNMLDCAVPHIYKHCNQNAATFFHTLHTVFWAGINNQCLLQYPRNAGLGPQTGTTVHHIYELSSPRPDIHEISTRRPLSSACGSEEIRATEACAQELLGFWDPLTIFENVQKLHEFCSTNANSENCHKRRLNCGSDLADGIVLAAFYVCSEIRNELVASFGCLDGLHELPRIKKCLEQFRTSHQAIIFDLTVTDETYCSGITKLLSCAKPAVDQACASGFWDLIVGVQGRIFNLINPESCAIAVITSKGVCTKDQERELKHCDRVTSDLIIELNQKTPEFSDFLREELQQLCNALREHESCVEQIPCSTPLSAVYESLFFKACTDDGHLEVTEHVVQCLGKVKADPKSAECNRLLPDNFNIDRFIQGDFDQSTINMEFICNHFDPFVQCSEPLGITNCGNDIWNILQDGYNQFVQLLDIKCSSEVLPPPTTAPWTPSHFPATNPSVTFAPIQQSTECSSEEHDATQACAQELLGYWDPLTIFESIQMLNRFCDAYQSSEDCQKRKLNCGSDLAEGIILAAFHVCSEIRNELTSSFDCLRNLRELPRTKKCLDDFVASNSAITVGLTLTDDQYCSGITTLLSCAKPVMEEVCKFGVWDLIVGVQGRIIHGVNAETCSVAVITSKGVCTKRQEADLKHCDRVTSDLIKELNQKTPDFSDFHVEELREFCNALREHETCVEQIPCSTPLSAVYQSLFLKTCTDNGHLEVTEHIIQCFAHMKEDPRSVECSRLLPHDFSIETFVQGDFNESIINKEFICHSLDPFVRCSEPVAVANCGRDIWNILHDAYKLFVQYLSLECEPQILPTRPTRTTDPAFASSLFPTAPTLPPHPYPLPPETTRACHQARQDALAHSVVSRPQCQSNGNYHPLQCNITSGYCWCVNEETGVMVEGTRVAPGQRLPTCGVKHIFSCERIEWKEKCMPSGGKPQPVFRWYRHGDKCRAYRFPYCLLEAHVPPYPFKHKKDCQRICLNRRLDSPPVDANK